MKIKKMTKMVIALLSCGAFAALSATASAAVMTYTQTGFLSGSLGGTSFSNAAVKLQVTADTANVQYVPLFYGYVPSWRNAGVTTIDIAGFPTATFNGPDTFGVASVDLTIFNNGGYVAFANLTQYSNENATAILATSGSEFVNYALDTARSVTSPADTNRDATYSTTSGQLIVTGVTGNSTFTAAEVSAVPEPGSNLALLALGAGGLTLRRRLKRAA